MAARGSSSGMRTRPSPLVAQPAHVHWFTVRPNGHVALRRGVDDHDLMWELARRNLTLVSEGDSATNPPLQGGARARLTRPGRRRSRADEVAERDGEPERGQDDEH